MAISPLSPARTLGLDSALGCPSGLHRQFSKARDAGRFRRTSCYAGGVMANTWTAMTRPEQWRISTHDECALAGEILDWSVANANEAVSPTILPTAPRCLHRPPTLGLFEN